MFTGEIDAYILSHIDEEGDLLSALNRDANVNLLRPRMLSGHLQGRILKMFCRMIRPRRVLDLYVLCHFVYGGRHGRGGVDPYDRDQ
jgi:caffeoyl-CoA O-methyltransferase